MSSYSSGDAERDAFLAALARVFAEHRPVSEGYALCDLARLADVIGGGFDEPVGVSRDESGRILTPFSDGFNPIAREIGDECVSFAPTFPDGLPEWECIMYLTS